MIGIARRPSTISSGCSPIGQDHAVAARRSSVLVTPGNAGATRAISSCHLFGGREVEVLARAAARARRRCASPAWPCPRATTLRATRCTRPSRLVIVPSCSPQVVTGRKTSAALSSRSGRCRPRSRTGAGDAGGGQRRGRGSRRAGRRRAAPARRCRRRPRRAGCRSASRPRLAGDRAPRILEPVASGVERRPGRAGSRARGRDRARRARCRAAARRGSACRSTPASAEIAATVASADSARLPRPTITTRSPSRSAARPRRRRSSSVSAAAPPSAAARSATTARLLARRVADARGGVGRQARGGRRDLDQGDPQLDCGARARR